MLIERATIGASVSMTPKEADVLAGNGPIRMVTCDNGLVIGGVGCVGFAQHSGNTDVLAFIEEIKVARAKLKTIADGLQPVNPRANLFTFINIGA